MIVKYLKSFLKFYSENQFLPLLLACVPLVLLHLWTSVNRAIYGICESVPFDTEITSLLLLSHLSLTFGILLKGFFQIFRSSKTRNQGQFSAFLALVSLLLLFILVGLHFTGMACP
jgi:hypothetical protein